MTTPREPAREPAHGDDAGPAEGRARQDATGRESTRTDGVRADAVPDEGVRDEGVRGDRIQRDHALGEPVHDDTAARERFGGANWGAAFFGWLVAVGMTALLTGILAVIATAVGYSSNIIQSDTQRQAGTIGLVAALVLLAVLIVAYYAGGYVAGRMSRFDGARQGLAVWVVGFVVTLIAAALGWIAGSQYNLLDRVDVPRIPIPSQDVTIAGILVGLAVLLVTLLAAMLGGKVGRRYHLRVDRATETTVAPVRR